MRIQGEHLHCFHPHYLHCRPPHRHLQYLQLLLIHIPLTSISFLAPTDSLSSVLTFPHNYPETSQSYSHCKPGSYVLLSRSHQQPISRSRSELSPELYLLMIITWNPFLISSEHKPHM